MTSLSISPSVVTSNADLLEFGIALRNTKDPKIQARAVATYRRLKDRADKHARTLSEAQKNELLGAAHFEVARRAHDRAETHKLKMERLQALKEMREEIEFSA